MTSAAKVPDGEDLWSVLLWVSCSHTVNFALPSNRRPWRGRRIEASRDAGPARTGTFGLFTERRSPLPQMGRSMNCPCGGAKRNDEHGAERAGGDVGAHRALGTGAVPDMADGRLRSSRPALPRRPLDGAAAVRRSVERDDDLSSHGNPRSGAIVTSHRRSVMGVNRREELYVILRGRGTAVPGPGGTFPSSAPAALHAR